MYKILRFFVVFTLFFSFLKAADIKSTDIINAFNDLNRINSQIYILTLDLNSTDSNSLSSLNVKKNKIISDLPNYILKTEFSKKDLNKFENKKVVLQKNMLTYSKNKSSDGYAKNFIELKQVEIEEILFKNIFEVAQLLKSGSKSSEIRNLLENSIIELNVNSYTDSSAYGVQHSEALHDIKIQKQTAEEILSYLKNNVELLSSSFALNELNLNTGIDYINNMIPIHIRYLNFGKIILIVFIFGFFVSLTRLLSKFTFWFLTLFLPKGVHSDAMKDQILKIIKRPIATILIAYALKICASVGYYPLPMPLNIINFFNIFYTVLICWLVITALNGYGMFVISEIAKKSGRKEVVNLIIKIVNFIIIIIALLLVLSRLGFDISAIIASLGIGGLAVAFAAKDIIANFFASVMLLFDNSFSQDDFIVCGNIEGTIVEIGLRKTTIRSFDNALISVPNSTLTNEPIINWSRRKIGRIINITIGLTYDSAPDSLKKCIADIKDMLAVHPDISREDNGGSLSSNSHLRFRKNIVSIDELAGCKSDIYVALNTLNSSSIDIAIICYTKAVGKLEYMKVREDVIFKIMDIVANNGLDFAFPSQSLYFQNQPEVKN
ncbi:mechanosensitive ion channel family protein [Campylobacter pinnipediorum]|uniref:mechanosensitive ion channel family protein n=1 Tax=Campylobacter pinnipediorum TaxID=1965231 RepID=UPI00084DAC50|nr:mechanosensitive ion channel family protein [Campylobacter pinnipediorum]